jgi:prepilin-type N-terminal cleavage/methylation domain-containing protein
MRNRRGLSLLELLVAMVIMGIIMGAAMTFFVGQSKSLRRGTSDTAMLQNIRYGADLLNQHFRSVGANTTPGQPPIIYADQNVFSFNADYATNTPGDLNAIYYTPKAPNSEVNAIAFSNQITVPGQATATYPPGDYMVDSAMMSPAEMITFWFEPDTSTTRPDDYMLLRQVNDSPPEVVVLNILQDTVPFLRYLYLRDSASSLSIDTVASSQMPLRFDVVSDTVKNRILANLRAVIVSYIVTNGLTGPNERTRPMTLVAPFPNMQNRELKTCGNDPVSMLPPTAVWNGVSQAVDITFAADGDETSGERDIVNYVLWRRPVGALNWGAPFLSIPAGNPPTYLVHDATVPRDPVNPVAWEYAVAAQDCTPNYSNPVLAAAAVTIPPAP